MVARLVVPMLKSSRAHEVQSRAFLGKLYLKRARELRLYVLNAGIDRAFLVASIGAKNLFCLLYTSDAADE